MTYLITFLEGIFSFLSPCMLPLLPVYLTYFAGSTGDKRPRIPRILAFIGGFTVTFLLLGLFFSALGSVLSRYQTAVHLLCGGVIVLFGLSLLDVIHLPLLHGGASGVRVTGVLSAFVFGVVYSVNLTPCIGAFLGSALLLATSSGSLAQGVLLLLLYSLGLGIPFLLSALLVSHLDSVFSAIKRHYTAFHRVCGGFLILIGVLTALGLLERWIHLLT